MGRAAAQRDAIGGGKLPTEEAPRERELVCLYTARLYNEGPVLRAG